MIRIRLERVALSGFLAVKFDAGAIISLKFLELRASREVANSVEPARAGKDAA